VKPHSFITLQYYLIQSLCWEVNRPTMQHTDPMYMILLLWLMSD